MALDPSVTVLVTRTVRAGREADYEEWVKGVAQVVKRFEGHLGLNMVRPQDGSRDYTLVFRFDTEAHLTAWERSDVRREWVARALEMTEGGRVQRLTGMETWFAVPGQGAVTPPPRWKMVIVSFGVAFPTIQILNATLGAFLSPLPVLARGAAIGLAMVLFMTYAGMPFVTRRLAFWLYPR